MKDKKKILFQNDKEGLLKAISKDPHILQYASEELKNDKEVVLKAVSKYFHILEYTNFVKELLKQLLYRFVIL